MEVADVLIWEGLSAPLRRPVMVVALTGWFDAAGVATSALEQRSNISFVTMPPKLLRLSIAIRFTTSLKFDPRFALTKMTNESSNGRPMKSLHCDSLSSLVTSW